MNAAILRAALAAFLLGSAATAQVEPDKKQAGDSPQTKTLTRLAQAVLGKNGGDQFFYVPTHDFPQTPATAGFQFEDVKFKTADDVELRGWFLPAAQGPARGTVVYSHGNAGSMAYHLWGVHWLVKGGFNVLMYDYRGYGKSGGTITREGLVKDVEAAFGYIRSRADIDKQRIVSFGHSLGGALSLTAVARNPGLGVRAVVTNAAFASFKEMGEIKLRQFGRDMVSDDLSPVGLVPDLKVPLLIIHGLADDVVPVAQGRELFAAARGDKKMFEVPKAEHGTAFDVEDGAYAKQTMDWLTEKLNAPVKQ